MNKVDEFIRDLKNNPNMTWVANEIEETLSRGVSMSVKEATGDNRFFQLVESNDITTKERNKRQKYETSRSYTEDEKIEVIQKALEVIFLDLPAIRESTVNNLNNLGVVFDSIQFSSSDDELMEQEIIHEIDSNNVLRELKEYKEAHQRYLDELN